jgi:hypothetical protein
VFQETLFRGTVPVIRYVPVMSKLRGCQAGNGEYTALPWFIAAHMP